MGEQALDSMQDLSVDRLLPHADPMVGTLVAGPDTDERIAAFAAERGPTWTGGSRA